MEHFGVKLMAALVGAYVASWLWQAARSWRLAAALEPQRIDTNFWRRIGACASMFLALCLAAAITHSLLTGFRGNGEQESGIRGQNVSLRTPLTTDN